MPKKEDRSDWVAVEPEFASGSGGAAAEIKRALTAYQYFQKERGGEIKEEITQNGSVPFDIAVFGRAVRDKWNNEVSQQDREYFEGLARQDSFRFRQESHAADVAAIQRRERLQQERSQIMLDDQGGSKRTTRGGWERKQRKKAKGQERKRKKSTAKKSSDGEEEAADDDDEESEEWDSGESDEDDSDDDDNDGDGEPKKKKRKKAAPPPPRRQVSQKQLEYQQKKKEEKMEKVTYIAERQQDLRRERAEQAKKRLEFLLKQSNIFSHFGSVKEDTAKYGISTVTVMPKKKKNQDGGELYDDDDDDDNADNDDSGGGGGVTTTSSRRKAAEDNDALQEESLEEADEHEATFLTQQPTTLGHGSMRDYQLEGKYSWILLYILVVAVNPTR